jgi:subtilisin family serine protease
MRRVHRLIIASSFLAAGLVCASTSQAPAQAPFDIPGEILVRTRADTPQQALEPVIQAADLTILESARIALLDSNLYRLRASSVQSVPTTLDALRANIAVLDAQPNQRYRAERNARQSTQQAKPSRASSEQYVFDKFHLSEIHHQVTGAGVRVAVIDSSVDVRHPELAAAIERSGPDATEQPHTHGTGMAGAIAAQGRLVGVAPGARLLVYTAFSANSTGPSTFAIVKGVDWAVEQRAQVINMSFAGPRSRVVEIALKSAYDNQIVLVAAAGNAGPNSPPLYPGADPNVIAVSATDDGDEIYGGATRGLHIAVSAPGVNILAPAPGASYQLTTGTSVAAAHVTGVVALLLQSNPALKPGDIRRILTITAKKLVARPEEVGAGLVDPAEALKAARPTKTR